MKPINFKKLSRHLALGLVYISIGGILATSAIIYFFLDSLPELEPWHLIHLENEYGTEHQHKVTTLKQYQLLEETLFKELDQTVYDQTHSASQADINRFNKGSRVDPTSYTINWNRTITLPTRDPRSAVLMLHGLSDSPYSMRKLAEKLNQQGSWVASLRLPGHGTAPSSLASVTWKDFIAAVRMAAKDLHKKAGADIPFYIVGYSNGAALAIEYALAQLEGEPLPKVTGLILISPAIGVSPIAAFASWKRRLSYLPGFNKLRWNTIQPEFDPYKYNSFPINGAEQIYYLTQTISAKINRINQGQGVHNFPPTLVFTSAVDDTVRVDSIVDSFLLKLTPNNHQLVIYDRNRETNASFLSLENTGARKIENTLFNSLLPFNLLVLTNKNESSNQLIQISKPENLQHMERKETKLSWPQGVYSLSHVALPFSSDDPIYGDPNHLGNDQVSLGNISLRGERGLLQVPDNQLMRLRYNPFYSFQEQLIVEKVRGLNID